MMTSSLFELFDEAGGEAIGPDSFMISRNFVASRLFDEISLWAVMTSGSGAKSFGRLWAFLLRCQQSLNQWFIPHKHVGVFDRPLDLLARWPPCWAGCWPSRWPLNVENTALAGLYTGSVLRIRRNIVMRLFRLLWLGSTSIFSICRSTNAGEWPLILIRKSLQACHLSHLFAREVLYWPAAASNLLTHVLMSPCEASRALLYLVTIAICCSSLLGARSL
jgi:hypothetical protein